VPFIIKWPNEIKAGGVCKDLAATIDVLPTLAGITGAKLPEMNLDGSTILDLCKSTGNATTPHDYFFMVYKGQAVRNGDWKYHKKRTFTVNKNTTTDENPALYNLKEDVGETKNIINEYPEIAQKLSQALEDHLTRLNIKK
jgi:arylsulfatase A